MPLEGTISPASAPVAPQVGGAGPGVTTVKFTDGGTAPPMPPPAPAEPKVEAPPAPVKEVESWRLAALAQKEKALRETAASAKAERAAAEQARNETLQMRQEFANRQQAYRQNPMLLLQEHGYDYDSVTRYVAQGGWSPEEQQAAMIASQQRAIQALAQQREQDRQEDAQRRADEQRQASERQTQAQKQAEASAVQEFKQELHDFVKAEPETYEMIGFAGENAMAMVYGKIEEHYQKTGQRLSNKDAADAVEADLVKEAERVVAGSKKLQSRFAPQPGPAAPAPALRTLSNNLQSPPKPPEVPQHETESQRRARVTAAINQAWGRR
jgi:hypothetical protein